MPFTEALFWLGMTILGAGIYFLVEEHRRLPAAVFCVIGLAAIAAAEYVLYSPGWPWIRFAEIFSIAASWISIILMVIWKRPQRASAKGQWKSTGLIRVTNKTFMNETVILDGHVYSDCTFENVRLKWTGTAPYEFVHNTFSGLVLDTTGNDVVSATVAILRGLSMLRDDLPVQFPASSRVEPAKPIDDKPD